MKWKKEKNSCEPKDWILLFGKPLIIQKPDWNDVQIGTSNETHDYNRRYAWLTVFDDDGTRLR